eukprot:CAMPEP_0174709502 /NCGR_PEP_ID=MMETSP1094-20130205/11431_1 /TAXON_ID=156173 /ORGANISM="Chrysochromulina brevifilum, Strain UTEX LB 985" /LENGTH=149 /DNA_ID=CAMNT_0015908187 /DNA_START=205 /DNA_END=654 /DNA_ORIENTATION=+
MAYGHAHDLPREEAHGLACTGPVIARQVHPSPKLRAPPGPPPAWPAPWRQLRARWRRSSTRRLALSFSPSDAPPGTATPPRMALIDACRALCVLTPDGLIDELIDVCRALCVLAPLLAVCTTTARTEGWAARHVGGGAGGGAGSFVWNG